MIYNKIIKIIIMSLKIFKVHCKILKSRTFKFYLTIMINFKKIKKILLNLNF